MGNSVDTVFGGLNEKRFKYLFIVLMIGCFGFPILGDSLAGLFPWYGKIINLALFLAVLWTSSIITSLNRRVYLTIISASIAALILNGLYILMPERGLLLANHAIISVILIHIIMALTVYLFVCKDVTHYTLLAAFSSFLLIALLWAMFYGIIDMLDPEAFTVPLEIAADGRLSSLGKSGSFQGLYFSMVTITTLGYGDISPISSEARAVATAEAFVGQLYMAVMIARLVGIYAAKGLAKRAD
jgi:hypothetical protein